MERPIGQHGHKLEELDRHQGTAKDRLRILAASTDNLCAYTLEEIGDKISVTKQMVHLLMPNFAAKRREYLHQQRLKLLQDFIEEHPEALLSKSRGGLSMREISERTSISQNHFPQLWQELDLPDRKLLKKSIQEARHETYVRNKEHHRALVRRWRSENEEKFREIARKANRKYRRKILRGEICQHCGKNFDWTQQNERSMKLGRRHYVSCSNSCSHRLSHQQQAGTIH